MEFLISNDIKVKEPTEEMLELCKKELVIDNPDYINALKAGRYTGNIDKKMMLYSKVGDTLILPFGFLYNIKDFIKKYPYTLAFHQFLGNTMQGSINLYGYQRNAVNRLKLGKNGILQAPCGSGKTQMGLQLIKELGGRALWLTHTKKLLEQSKERCEKYFKGDFGTITEGFINIGKDITFATVQTMSKIEPEIYKNAFDVVVIDECHHSVGSPTKVMQFYKVITNCNARYKYGLSATLTRSDNLIKSLYAVIGSKLHTIESFEVGSKIIKAKYESVNIGLKYDQMKYINFDGTIDYIKLINMLSYNDERNEIIIDKVKENLGHKQLILCHRVKQVEILASLISKFASVSAVYGKSKDRNFDADIIVATFQLAKEGLDIPELDVLHLATPQKNESTTKQAVGRIERNVAGKEQPVCYDYIDEDIDYCVRCAKIRKKCILK